MLYVCVPVSISLRLQKGMRQKPIYHALYTIYVSQVTHEHAKEAYR